MRPSDMSLRRTTSCAAVALLACLAVAGCGERVSPRADLARTTDTAEVHAPVASDPTVVSLEHLDHGPLPPLDVVDRGFRYHQAGGRVIAMADPTSVWTIQGGWQVGRAGLVVLHDDGAWQVAVDEGEPHHVLDFSGELEDWRSLQRGPHGSVVMAGAPGQLISIGAHGSVSTYATHGRRDISLTRGYVWGTMHHHVWRLDPAHLSRGWERMGRGSTVYTNYDADGVITPARSRSCELFHDAATYAVRWRLCGDSIPQDASGEGRYVVLSRGLRYARVVDTRTGERVLTLDAGRAGYLSPLLSDGGTWSGDDVLMGLKRGVETQRFEGDVACSVTARTCHRVTPPRHPEWIGAPTGT